MTKLIDYSYIIIDEELDEFYDELTEQILETWYDLINEKDNKDTPITNLEIAVKAGLIYMKAYLDGEQLELPGIN